MNNPLDQYYRTKEIYVKLPTQGKWYNNPPILTPQGEIGILPMTVRDEMLLNIPDALFNGESLFSLFRSIAPDIIEPYEICMPDVDVILLASRAASYDDKLDIESRCPKCGTINPYRIDISNILSKVIEITEIEVEINNLTFILKPNTLKTVNASNILNMANQKMIEMMLKKSEGDTIDQEIFDKSLADSTGAVLSLIADGIKEVITPNGDKATEFSHIIDYLNNTNSETISTLKKHIREINKNGIERKFPFKCVDEKCNTEYTNPIEYNPAFFFKKP